MGWWWWVRQEDRGGGGIGKGGGEGADNGSELFKKMVVSRSAPEFYVHHKTFTSHNGCYGQRRSLPGLPDLSSRRCGRQGFSLSDPKPFSPCPTLIPFSAHPELQSSSPSRPWYPGDVVIYMRIGATKVSAEPNAGVPFTFPDRRALPSRRDTRDLIKATEPGV